jgi:hypothetical protein
MMKKNLILIFGVFFLILSCTKEEVIEKYDNGASKLVYLYKEDNGKKIKVYDDNNKNAIIHLRFMYNYDYSGDKPFIISNLFGITLPEFNAVDTGWQKPTITIGGKPQMVP